MIPILKIKPVTALAVFAATLGVSSAITRLQAMYPQVRQITGGTIGQSEGLFGWGFLGL